MGSTAIHIRNLVVGFGSKTILNHLNLDVRQGEILGLVGASGGGKSVLMRALVGLLPKRGGQIDYVDHGKGERNWGILFQQGALFSALTARQNVQFPLRENAHLSPRLLDEIADAKLEMVGLSRADGDKFPSELSGGMTKRVALARALALDPALLFLDEPTSGLDPIAAGEFDALIRTLHRTLRFTVFMVTHDLNSLQAICDRVAALAEGRIVTVGPLSSVLESDHPWVKAYFHGARAQTLGFGT
ncbi:ATP-binding cassette domain-containing protein [Bradyrhizobium viridifuturi]|jgi:phospholipid/cholesterol/gamma-HCH transport system ATP-binding protein|nr:MULTISPECIES: ATP-binding cassette domain-containing protein [Bradyrhizobium]ERF82324.1 MAG: ABC transporter ATP-binding protein [Bradyrhizobium sp. DFCI-1]MCA3798570.1 ATP-binding cassette domain-containing protein [Burkholderia sp.]OYU60943.1 MAG: ABC transporter ATP-binding protein [Bradyrhizobium sp. PARBB1]PSO22608.1 ABC transporter ATP-binding protein [Bradyrhizobium sp. MOS004]QRI68798.1 ATP-binding cassette domain-containing protein [Bradyrhizobium sp. PSBB068]